MFCSLLTFFSSLIEALNIPFTSTAINFVYGGMTSKAKYYYVIVRLESCIKRKGRKIYRLKT